MINENFIYVGLFISAIGGLYYLLQTIQGKVQPNRVTWLLWGLGPLIAFAAQYQQGVGVQSLLTLVLAVDPLLVFFGTFVNKKAYWKLNKIDFLFGGLAIVGLVLWQITGVGNIAILFSILADAFAAIPTIIKSFHHPESENAFAYYTAAIGAGITLLTINEWNFATYAFSVYILGVCSILSFLILTKIGPRLAKKK